MITGNVSAENNKKFPKNIIFFIGDGMGLSQITAARIVNGYLNLEKLPVTGLQTTWSNNDLLTDSAASGTALATGYKTNNGVIAQTPEGQPLKTLFEYAKEHNKATGLVVSSSVTHATPAVFVSHTDSRKNQLDIARQIAEGDIDVILGGGLGYFISHSQPGSFRDDERDLLAQLKQKMPVVLTAQQFQKTANVKRLAGLFARKNLPKASDNRQPSLTQMTAKALQILAQNPEGFVLMVEGSQIDWGGHQNNQSYMLSELIDFDSAVGVALEFIRNHSQTLMLVTADHETGGYALNNGSLKNKTITEGKFTTTHHTAVMVPVFAAGAGSQAFSGMMDDTDIGRKLIEYVRQ